MSGLPDRVDVAVVGAGTAGAAAAALLARGGMRVLCVDRRPLDDSGARWVNGVPARDFDRAGFERPRGDELLGEGVRFHLVAGYGPERIVIEGHGGLEVDMRGLVARLQACACEAGAIVQGGVPVRGYEGGVLHTGRGAIRAGRVVAAAGLSGPDLLPRPRVLPRDLCSAAQEVRRIRDAAGARAFFEERATPPGEVLCFTGIAGGYSILNVRAHEDRISILTGSVTAEGQPSGRAILDRFCAEQPWIGERIFGGSRAIPIRRPFDVLASDRVAALGDAGCQVFPAHGSGIGAGLVAARALADTLAAGATPHDYAVRWQRAHGGLLASYDLFRRFSQRLPLADLRDMMAAGLMDPELARAGMNQELPEPSPALLARKLPALARRPALAARLGSVTARMALARALYARYPGQPSRLPGWSRRVAGLFGDRPDVDAHEPPGDRALA